jgi:hypothetical protein
MLALYANGEKSLERNSLPMDNDIRNELSLESDRVEEDCELSSKSHFVAASCWARIHYLIGVPSAIVAAIASISAFTDNTTAAGILAILVAALGAVATFLNPSGKSTEHVNAANSYLTLLNRTRIFRNIELKSLTTEEAQERLIQLAEQKDGLNSTSPQIPECAFRKARKNIEDGQTKYRADSTSQIRR